MKLLNIEDVKWIEDSYDDVKKLAQNLSTEPKTPDVQADAADGNAFAKIKSFVRKAVDCCIE